MRTQGCRDTIDWVLINCHGLSPNAAAEVKLAGRFCRERAPYLELQSTKAINAIRVIKDPIIQGKVLEIVKTAIEIKTDPRTGTKLHDVAGVTTPMVQWILQWVETGTKPTYIPRTTTNSPGIQSKDIMPLVDKICLVKFDRKIGQYLVSEELMEEIKAFKAVHTCNQASQ